MNAPTPDLLVRVRARDDVGPVAVLDLEAIDGRPLPAWEPGAHVDVLLPGGVVRQYSLCGRDPGHWRIAVLREDTGRGGSVALHDLGSIGAELALAGPRNHFGFHPGETPVLLVAGGIGITPLLPMAAAAAAAGLDFTLHVVGHGERLPFLDELSGYGDRLVVHRADLGERLDLEAVLAAARPGTVVYTCGPRRLLDSVEKLAAGRGLEVHLERFEPIETPQSLPSTSFEIGFAASGVEGVVEPGESILQVAESLGIFVLSSCQEGTCGTCETVVLEGDVDHRDSILTPAERERGDLMYVCVSRARGARLVVDL